MPWFDETTPKPAPAAQPKQDYGKLIPCKETAVDSKGMSHSCMTSDYEKLGGHTHHFSMGSGTGSHAWDTKEPSIPTPAAKMPSTLPSPTVKAPVMARFITHTKLF